MANRVGLLGMMIFVCAAALTGCEARIAVCDLDHVVKNYSGAELLRTQVRDRQAEIKAESNRRQKRIDALGREMSRYRRDPRMYEQALREHARQEMERDVFLRYQEHLLRSEQGRQNGEINKDILDAVAEVAAERGVTVVLRTQGRNVLYHAEPVDITQAVLTALERRRARRQPEPATAPADGG